MRGALADIGLSAEQQDAVRPAIAQGLSLAARPYALVSSDLAELRAALAGSQQPPVH